MYRLPARLFLFLFLQISLVAGSQKIWTPERAWKWQAQQPWLTGCNYLPVSAINQLEMWQAETFDTASIEKELALAESIGFNTLRVFLHDLLWKQDAAGFKKRLDVFLRICERHHIRPMLVFFDSCWDPFPATGPQHAPVPGLHNSGWVQSPGARLLADTNNYGGLEAYVRDIVRSFRNDRRILCWDMWNEPDNTNGSSYGAQEPAGKLRWVNALLPRVFAWARAEAPVQPLTSGLWTWWGHGWSKDSSRNLSETERIQLANSDIISFHCYNDSTTFRQQLDALLTRGRPVLCTEYMARGENSTVFTIMPLAKRYKLGVINWGFADGKEQTKFPWDSWNKHYTEDPRPWHHVLFHSDYSPYRPDEIEFIRQLRR